MKSTQICLIFFILLFGTKGVLIAQGGDSLYYNRIEPVVLELGRYPHGDIRWQQSPDLEGPWEDIPGAAEISLTFETDSSTWVRAQVLSGTCEPVYSSLAFLEALRIYTGEVDSMGSEAVKLLCEFDTGNTTIAEYGLIYGQAPLDDQHSSRISLLPPVQEEVSLEIGGLDAGEDYAARAFGLTEDGDWIYGNERKFTTVSVDFSLYLNISTDTAAVFYEVKGLEETQVDRHGIMLSNFDGTPVVTEIEGSTGKDAYMAVARGLKPGTGYQVQAFVQDDTHTYFSEEKEITTWSLYDDPVDPTSPEVNHIIAWEDPSTAVKLTPEGTFGEYGRVERLGSSDTLLLVYHGGPNNGDWINIYIRKSFDNGTTWTAQETIMDLGDYPGQYWRFCTPELLSLQNGWILLAFEANARPDENKSSVQILISKDSAKSWQGPLVYPTGRTWEPALVQLPNGEIELFYSSEAKWWPGNPLYQDIQVIRSTDNGLSWSDPQVVAYYPNARDGMPVPLVLPGNRGVVFAIETVGWNYSPGMIHRDMGGPWILATDDFYDSDHRWYVRGFEGHGGAPYLLQLPTGEILLSAHIFRGGDWHQNNYQQVMVGDSNAKNFEALTTPWGKLPVNESAVNNSLFLKDEHTVVSISCRMFPDGSGGLYWLEGTITPKTK